jgi:iron complex outermembrane receptor protein
VKNRPKGGSVRAIASVVAVLSGAAAHAQNKPESDGVPDIVVTAERTETALQRTPAAVTVINGDALKQKQIVSILDLNAILPNVGVGVGLGGQAQIAIRGIGYSEILPGGDPRVAFYVDGIYVPRPSATLSAFYDVDRVEVLRGPQGTLYGRNATGGAFNLLTRAPTRETSGYFDVTAGNYNLIEMQGALSGPISETVSARVAFQKIDHGGWGENLVTGNAVDNQHSVSVRGKLRWDISPTARIDVSANFHREDDRNYALHYFGQGQPNIPLAMDALGFPTLSFSRDLNGNTDTANNRKSFGTSVRGTFDLSGHLTLVTSASYDRLKSGVVNDGDGTPFFAVQTEQSDNSRSYSGEVQLLGKFDRLQFVTGLYYFYEESAPQNRAPINAILVGGPDFVGQGALQTSLLKTNSFAIYGQFTFDVTDKLSITAGGRYGREKKSDIGDFFQFDESRPYPPFQLPLIPLPGFPFTQHKTVSAFKPKLSVNYKLTPEIFLYATYQEGFKSGGFNYGSARPNYYAPETIKDYEGGIKFSMFDRKLQGSLSGFYYQYKNIQTQVLQPDLSGGFTDVIAFTNAAGARIYGSEIELVARPVRAVTLDLSASALNAEFTDFFNKDATEPGLGTQNLRGKKVPQSPSYKVNLGAAYTLELPAGALTLRGEYQRVGKTNFSVFNSPALQQKAYGMGNAIITYKANGDHWSATAFIRNIGNVFTKSGLFNQSGLLGSGVIGSNGPPRTYGVTIGYKL